MTGHLSPDEVVAAVDGSLGGAARVHLEECGTCRDAVAEWASFMSDVKCGDVPEPSPVFWDHLSARVREATESEQAPGRQAWMFSRHGLVLAGIAAGAFVAFAWSYSVHNRVVTIPPPAASSPSATNIDPDVSWQAMSDLAASMTMDDVRVATAPAPDRGNALSDLSDDERAVFVALLKLEMGDVE